MPLPPPPQMGPRPTMEPAVGPRSGAISFDVLAEIAVGATARVDLCRVLSPHPRAGQLLAVKRLHPHIAEDPTFANQFFDEAWMTASLRHPNVVEVAGWGTDDQGTYLAVELVQGVSLLRLMKTIFETGEAFTERMVVYIASRICRGLAAAHALTAPNGEHLHLVHRDLTPGNILVGWGGEVKIADFGMAKAKQRLTKTLTGMRKGEPTYMAPEQAQRDEIDARADLFSLGVMLFELFAGRRPWIAKSDFDMVQITLREPPADLRELRPKIDKELVNVVNRCLEKDPAARFQSAHEIAARLDEWLSVHGYQDGNEEALGRFVRRNAMRQMRWFERAVAGEMAPQKVGREAPPRVPTYTEHTRPSLPNDGRADTESSTAKQPLTGRPPPPAPPPQPATRPIVPSRTPSAPLDPRAARAQSAVQQLKKLAPPVEPPRARRRAPLTGSGPPRPASSLDDEEEDGDATDVELRVSPQAIAASRQLPELIDGDDDETGEELPTLVQRDDPQIKALRAEVRAKGPGRPPYVSPPGLVDEESDQRITEVKPEHRRGAAPLGAAPLGAAPLGAVSLGAAPLGAVSLGAAPLGAVSLGAASELPTEPIKASRPHPDTDPTEAPTPVAIRAKPAAVPAPAQRSKGPPPRAVIPPSPDVPPRPFAPSPGGVPKIPPVPSPGARPKTPATPLPPPPEGRAERAARITARPPPSPPAPVDASRASQHDDVQVIDRAALQQIVLGSEESLLAEADRMAIEAVRRGEEARAAQLRAERKAAAAKLANEAALVAADAVRLARSSGLPMAFKRLEEARQIEQAIQSGKLPGGDATGAVRVAPASLPAPPPSPAQATLMSGVPAASPSSFPSAVPPAPSSYPASVPAASNAAPPSYPVSAPAPPADQGSSMMFPSVPPSAPASLAPPPHPPARPSFAPPEPSAPAFASVASTGSAMVTPPPGSAATALPSPRAAVDPEVFQKSLKPSFFGAPGGAVAALAAIALVVVIVLVLLLAK